jgi:prephenate dehydrogenase
MSGYRRVAVIGLGVMGGSFARALTASEAGPEVRGWSPDAEERHAALFSGAVVSAPKDWREAVRDADLVVLATPLRSACRLISDLAAEPALQDATIMDVSSLKAPIVRAAEAAGVSHRFVGAHPMAGSEASGFFASGPDLFSGSLVWIVADSEARAHTDRVETLWSALGAEPERTTAASHDRLMSLVSHLPQLTANGLAAVLNGSGITPGDLGPGGKDMTRLAASNPVMWEGLLDEAHPDLVHGLRALAEHLADIADRLEGGDVASVVSRMKTTRNWTSE